MASCPSVFFSASTPRFGDISGMTPNSKPLFSKYSLRGVLEVQGTELEKAVSSLNADILMASDPAEIQKQFVERFHIDVPVLLEDAITVDQTATKVVARGVADRYVSDRTQPFYIDAVEVTYYLPFRGDGELFLCKPSTFTLSYPYAELRTSEHELRFSYEDATHNVAATKPRFERDLREVKQWLGWVASECEAFNAGLRGRVDALLEGRRSAASKAREGVASLGFKVRQREPVHKSKPASPPPHAEGKAETHRRASGASAPAHYEVAFSYASEQHAYVDAVFEALKGAGVTVFYDRSLEVELWGRNLAEYLADVYRERSRFVVMFISESYGKKAWPKHERQNALSRAIREEEVYVLPVRFDETEIPGLSPDVKYLDARQLSPEKLAEAIIRKVRS